MFLCCRRWFGLEWQGAERGAGSGREADCKKSRRSRFWGRTVRAEMTSLGSPPDCPDPSSQRKEKPESPGVSGALLPTRFSGQDWDRKWYWAARVSLVRIEDFEQIGKARCALKQC